MLLFFTLWGYCLYLSAQPDSLQTAVLHTNNLSVHFRNDGVLWQNEDGDSGLWYYREDGQDSVALAKSLRIVTSWRDPGGNLFMAPAVGENSFLPGMKGDNGAFNKIWKVTREQVSKHHADWIKDEEINDPISAIYGWPGRGNPYFEQINGTPLPDGQNLPLAPFVDLDYDGIYDPGKGDYPFFKFGQCGTILDRVPGDLIWFPFYYVDMPDQDITYFQHSCTAFSFDCKENGILGNVVLIKLEYTNRGLEQADSLAYSLVWDKALANPYSGILGNDYSDGPIFAYADQAESKIVSGWGVMEPFYGYAGQNIKIKSHLVLDKSPSAESGQHLPTTFSEWRNVHRGLWKDGTPLTAQGLGYLTSGEVTTLAFSDLPINSTWSDLENDRSGKDLVQITTFDYSQSVYAGQFNAVTLGFMVVDNPVGELNENVTNMADNLAALESRLWCFDYPLDDSIAEECDLDFLPQGSSDINADELSVTIVPNPAYSYVKICVSPAVLSEQIRVYDVTGSIVHQSIIREDFAWINVENWPQGFYFFRVGSSRKGYKLVVK